MENITIKCKFCGTILSEKAIKCPNCKAPKGAEMLSFSGNKAALDKDFSQSLARVMSKSLLEKADALDNFSSEIERITQNSLTTADIQEAITHINEVSTPNLVELEKMLSLDAQHVTLEGIKLSELLDGKADDKDILRKGLLFLKHRKYAEAVEWWTINRQKLDTSRQRLQFVLLIMEAFTYILSGDKHKVNTLRQQIRHHALYERYRM